MLHAFVQFVRKELPPKKESSAYPVNGQRTHRPDEETALAITIYGIKSCDTMKKARTWLEAHDVAHDFHDYKTAGIDRARLEKWCGEVGWEMLLNRAGTTFRKLPEADKAGLDEAKAIRLMLAQPSMIKRPVLDLGGKLLVGFNPQTYARSVRTGQAGK